MWRLSPCVHTVCWTPVIGERSLSPADAVRIFFIQPLLNFSTAQTALQEVLQEVSAEEHVDPGIATTVQAGQKGGDSNDNVLRLYVRKEKSSALLSNKQLMAFMANSYVFKE